MTNDPKKLLDLAIDLAQRAGVLVRERRDNGLFQVATKSSATDLVTELDKASEQLIVGELTSHRPGDGILGEEGASTASSTGVEWVIDPIDGTTNFVYGSPNYAICIGARISGVPTAGVVYNPANDELFAGAIGHGATLNGLPISSNETVALDVALVATGFSYDAHRRADQGAVVAALLPQVRDIRRMGAAALDICNVACGRVDAYYEVGVHPWDVTAATVILREAGGGISGMNTEQPIDDAIGACTPELHRALSDTVAAS